MSASSSSRLSISVALSFTQTRCTPIGVAVGSVIAEDGDSAGLTREPALQLGKRTVGEQRVELAAPLLGEHVEGRRRVQKSSMI